MKDKRKYLTASVAGLAAGIVNGIFGAAGGMILIPALELGAGIHGKELFPLSVSVMLPVCIVSLLMSVSPGQLPWAEAFPYLIGSAAGGILAGLLGQRIPLVWLHRILGIMILWGGIRYLW